MIDLDRSALYDVGYISTVNLDGGEQGRGIPRQKDFPKIWGLELESQTLLIVSSVFSLEWLFLSTKVI